MNRQTLLIVLGLGAIVLAAVYLRTASEDETVRAGVAIVEVTVPDLSDRAMSGKTVFDQNCAGCHGSNAAGVDGSGPPLVHVIYEPGHHSDPAFYLAVEQGVRAHHWPFGDMAPIDGLERAEVASIIDYIREMQRANGID